MNRPRILIAGDYPRNISRGGVQAVVRTTAIALAAQGDLEIHVTALSPRLAESRTRNDQGVVVHDLRVPRLPASVRAATFDAAAVKALIERTSPHLIHAHSQEGHALAAVRSGRPCVVSVHGLLQAQNRLLDGFAPIRIARATLWRNVERRVLAAARDTIVMSRHVADAVQRDSSAELHWVPNPIDPCWCALADDPEPGRVLFVGLITPRKDLETLIRAVPLLPDWVTLRIAGAVDDAGYNDRMRAVAEELGLAQRVSFTGRLSHDELLEEYRRADLFALSSVEDSAPIAITQALAAGKPVVASDVGGIGDLVPEGEVGHLVPARDWAAFAQRITALLSDRARRREFSAAGRRRGAEHSPDRVAERLREVYAGVVARQGIGLPLAEQERALSVLSRGRRSEHFGDNLHDDAGAHFPAEVS